MLADICIRASDALRCLELGRKLGLDMVGLIVPLEQLPSLRKLREKRDWRLRPGLAIGLEAAARKPGQLRKSVLAVRRSAEIVVASGGTEDMNRAALEIPELDILIGHEIDGRPGINHVLARLAKKNGVAIGFDLGRLIASYRLGRIQEFSSMAETAKIVRRFGAPFVLTSGAREPWDMRSPSELLALGSQLGFTEKESRRGLSGGMVRENRKRLSGKWIMPGVEIE
jgi:ribonuclease P/MRP protein subunit RPP1